MHERALQVAKIIMGDDIEFDFDMLLSKVINYIIMRSTPLVDIIFN